jgi:hypothetical protein
MTDTEIVPRKSDREPADQPPLVDTALADELLARAQSEGVELLGPDGLLSLVTKAVLERALAVRRSCHPRDDAGQHFQRRRALTILQRRGRRDLDLLRHRHAHWVENLPALDRKAQQRSRPPQCTDH